MSTLLLPELARETADSNRRVAGFLEAELRRLEQALQKPEEARALKKPAGQSAREALTLTLSRKDIAQVVWRHALEALEDGLSGEQAKTMLQDVCGIIETWMRLAENSRQMWKFAKSLGSTSEGLEELDAAEKSVLQLKTTVEKMHAFLTRDHRPVDRGQLSKGLQEAAEGRFKTSEEMRLQFGRQPG